MARILLINVPFYRLLGSHYNANSLGIAYIAASLNEAGHEAYLYNADFVDRNEYSNLKGIFKGYTNYKSYFEEPEKHAIWEEVVQKILDYNPDWVGFTSYTANITAIDIISTKLKTRAPGIRQVIGGTHATLDKEILNKLKTIDYAVAREGEVAMRELVEGKDPKKIIGVASRNALGFINHNGDAETLDTDLLPFPEREKFWGLTPAQIKTVDVSYICSIRGCPHGCTYCGSPASWKRNKTQYRSPENIMKELRHLKKYYWGRHKEYDYSASANIGNKKDLIIKDNTLLYFVDDVFSINKPRVKQILNMMIDENLNMPFKCEVRGDQIDQEICNLLYKANCKRVKIGFETGSNRLLKEIKKGETKEKMLRGAKMLEVAKVKYTAYLMTGFPTETNDDLKETIAFAKELNAEYYSLSILSPYYGTSIYCDLVEQGFPLNLKPDYYFYHQSPEPMVNKNLDPELIKEYISLNELNKDKHYV